MIRLLLARMLLAAGCWPASAQDGDPRWAWKTIRQQERHCDAWGLRWRTHTVRIPKRRYAEDSGDGPRCRDMRRAVGDQHLTLDGAKKAANDAWAATVRFHLGEKFIDLGNARQVSYECSRSSIKEGGVTTLGQTFTRCEIEARPCRPGRQPRED